MSTRGAIARKVGNGFKGVYHHWDGYPSGLGQMLFILRKKRFHNDTQKMLDYLITQHPGGWSTISSLLKGKKEKDADYKVGNQSPQVTEKNAGGMGVEYAYVFDGDIMEIQSSYSDDVKMIGMFGMGDPKSTWKVIARVNLNGPEPNWGSFE